MKKVDLELVKILVCPENHEQVFLADEQTLDKVNQAIAQGHVQNLEGKNVDVPLQDGLLRADGRRLYPIREAIPVMLIGEAISMDQWE